MRYKYLPQAIQKDTRLGQKKIFIFIYRYLYLILFLYTFILPSGLLIYVENIFIILHRDIYTNIKLDLILKLFRSSELFRVIFTISISLNGNGLDYISKIRSIQIHNTIIIFRGYKRVNSFSVAYICELLTVGDIPEDVLCGTKCVGDKITPQSGSAGFSFAVVIHGYLIYVVYACLSFMLVSIHFFYKKKSYYRKYGSHFRLLPLYVQMSCADQVLNKRRMTEHLW